LEAATETGVTAPQDGSLADGVPDDLDVLRQAALQTTKSALSAEPAGQDAEQSAAADTIMADASSLPVKATIEPEHMETAWWAESMLIQLCHPVQAFLPL